jgi:hypothetical protein
MFSLIENQNKKKALQHVCYHVDWPIEELIVTKKQITTFTNINQS